jgi:hypothetical protein
MSGIVRHLHHVESAATGNDQPTVVETSEFVFCFHSYKSVNGDVMLIVQALLTFQKFHKQLIPQ